MAGRLVMSAVSAPKIRYPAPTEVQIRALNVLIDAGFTSTAIAEVMQFDKPRIGEWQSKWGARSIDEDLTGNGFRLSDVLPCDRAGAWVESVGG